MSLFDTEFEQDAINRIVKFSKIADALGYEVAVGFSGGKDSQVVYDLCKRSGIRFKAYFNHAFESSTTLQFIREHYPDVIWRRDHNFGFIENIWKNHYSLFPTVEMSYCCKDYKHNPKYVDKASVVGVRRSESFGRRERKVFETRNKTVIKHNKALFNEYFSDECMGTGTGNVIQLKPIVDWLEDDVWNYIKRYNLPINPEYERKKRVGCLVCPKADMTTNHIALMEHPKLIDAFIKAREKRGDVDWYIQTENKDFGNNKIEYICRWLNHSFRPFTPKQQKLFLLVNEAYKRIHQNGTQSIRTLTPQQKTPSHESIRITAS